MKEKELTTKDELNTLYENAIINENNDISIEEFKKDGWDGVDRSLDISLFEYGLIYKDTGKEFRVIYQTKENEYSFSWIDKKFINDLLDGEEWIDEYELRRFAETNGYDSIEDYKKENDNEERRLIDLHNYFNYLDLFGDVVESHSAEYVYNWLSEHSSIKESSNEETCEKYVTEANGIQYDLKFRKQALNDYLYTALWTEELEKEYDITDIDPESVEKAKSDIDSFIYKARKVAPEELSTYLNVGDDEPSLGGNIWLSRNGHGAGFFDQNNDKLQDLARKMNKVDMYVGDDNIVYIQG